MSINFEELDYQKTELGELILRRRRMLSLEGAEVFEIKLGASFLMSSLFTKVEVALAELALAELQGGCARCRRRRSRVGLHRTRRAAKSSGEIGSGGRSPTRGDRLASPRPGSLGRAIHLRSALPIFSRRLLPAGGLCRSRSREPWKTISRRSVGHRSFATSISFTRVTARSIMATRFAGWQPNCIPGGVFAMWSDDPPEEEFLQALDLAFASSRAHIVSVPQSFVGLRGSQHRLCGSGGMSEHHPHPRRRQSLRRNSLPESTKIRLDAFQR